MIRSLTSELSPNNATYYCNRAAAKTMLKDFAGALSDCKQAVSCDVQFVKAYLRASKCSLNLGNISEATRLLQNAEAVINSDYGVNDHIAQLQKELHFVNQIAQLIDQCKTCLENREYCQALSLIESVFMQLDNSLKIVLGKCI